ncbi:hypothetical protein ACH40E_38360, partial [Streptomyces acidicola]|uniref:hypothetical protein n=1 Tax=Streptomyces acidicola TaxID=2596892 RepID=UPI003799CA0A
MLTPDQDVPHSGESPDVPESGLACSPRPARSAFGGSTATAGHADAAQSERPARHGGGYGTADQPRRLITTPKTPMATLKVVAV